MKKKFILFIILIFCFYILLYPAKAVNASAKGLVLWYDKVLPALLPFSILSNILITSNLLTSVTGFFSAALKHLLPVSENGCFVLFSGFFFGFPMGSKNCAELLRQKKITPSEAEILFIFTNNISPVFINSYILYQQLKMPHLFAFSLLILYLPPVILADILLHKKASSDNTKKTASRFKSKMNFQIIDAGIMNGFETLVRIGGYIMLFSILSSLLQQLPLPASVKILAVGFLEITNGISYLADTALPQHIKFILAMMFTSFGGICGLAQTNSMVHDTGLSMKKYVCCKLLLTVISTLAAIITIFLIQHIR